jgi:hypothetical protein
MDKIGTRNKISDFLGSNSDRKRMSSMKLPVFDLFWPEIHIFRSNFCPKYARPLGVFSFVRMVSFVRNDY